jgi:hypothetical protein
VIPFVVRDLADAPADLRQHYKPLPSGRWELELDPADALVSLLHRHRIFLRRLEKAAKPFPAFVAMIDAAKLEALSTKKGTPPSCSNTP